MTHEEQQQQTALFNWAEIMKHQMPELALMYHIPNEGKRSKVSGAVLKSMGLKKGVPDVCLPAPRGGYGALYIEMKSEYGVVTQEQKAMMAALTGGGNKCVVCRSWTDAKEEIEAYLKLEKTPIFKIRVEREPMKGWKVEGYGDYIELRGASKQDLTELKKALLDQALAVAGELVKKNIEYVVKEDTVGWKMPFLVKKEES